MKSAVEVFHLPAFGHRAHWRIFWHSKEKGGGGEVEAGGLVAVEFGADGVEIDEPALEQRLRHFRLQRRARSAGSTPICRSVPRSNLDGPSFVEVVRSTR